jgi:hypothetical protein
LTWPHSFEQRLLAWNALRHSVAHQPLDLALHIINLWWFRTPWQPYYLHWDDLWDWPDPWQLLNDNIFCDVARALGIMYTITMLDRSDVTDLQMVETKNYNLVLVEQGKYILNCQDDQILNTNFETSTIRRTLTHSEVLQKLK